MDLRNRHQERSDDMDTQYIPLQEVNGKRSDQYDTQELSAEEIRRHIRSEQPAPPVRKDRTSSTSRSSGAPYEPYKPFTPHNSGYSRGYSSVPELPRDKETYRNPDPGRIPPENHSEYSGHRRGDDEHYYNNGYNNYNNNAYREPQPRRTPPPPPNYQRQTQNRSQNRPPAKSKRSGRPMWQSVLRFIFTAIIIIFVLYSAIAVVGIMRTNITATAERNRTEDALSSSAVDNILIIGTDSRDIESDTGRSDSIILLSINSRSKTIYLTSFLRDVNVYINDVYGSGKLNSAYSYGGPELLMDTIESNYSIKIDDYVVVSFAACAAVIDAVGGVEITLSDDEAQALNEILISEVNELMGDKRNDDLLECGGTYNLSGKQALSYSRIRYVGNADFERTSRQRDVMTIAMKKAAKNPAAICGIFLNALPKVTTNIHGLSLYIYSLKSPFLVLGYELKQQQIPADETFYPDTIGGESVLVADFDANNSILRNTVFEGIEY
ncbi:MAG: LCP family protein [Ruminococcus sp.]